MPIYLVTVNYQTKSGRPGSWRGNVVGADEDEARESGIQIALLKRRSIGVVQGGDVELAPPARISDEPEGTKSQDYEKGYADGFADGVNDAAGELISAVRAYVQDEANGAEEYERVLKALADAEKANA